MHSYWSQTISNDRIDMLRREANRRRLVATAARVPTESLSTRLGRQRLTALLASVAPLAPQPQPCTC